MNSFLPKIDLKFPGLPSKGLLYPVGSLISYFPFTFGEILTFSKSVLSMGSHIDFILSKIETNNMDKLDITYSDFCYIGMLINLSTFGTNKLSVEFECNNCNKKVSDVVDTKNVEFDELEEGKSRASIDINGKKLLFTPLTVRDYIDIINKDKLEDVSYLFAKQCRSDINIDEFSEYVKNPALVHSKLFDKIDKEFYHGILPVDLKCKECDTINKISVDGGIDTLVSPFCAGGDIVEDVVNFS